MFDDIDLDYLEEIIDIQLEKNKKAILFCGATEGLAEFIAQQEELTDGEKFLFTEMSFGEADKMVMAFFQQLNENLLDEYLNNRNEIIFYSQANLEEEKRYYLDLMYNKLAEGLISDGDYEYAKEYYTARADKKDCSISADGKIIVTLRDDFTDVYMIAHEHIHKFFSQPWQFQEKFNMDFLFEVPSLIGELILSDYLEQDGYEEDVRKYMQKRFAEVKKWAVWMMFYQMLFNVYLENNGLSLELIMGEIEKYDELIRVEFYKNKDMLIERFINTQGNIYFLLNRYIVGMMVACYIKDSVQNDLSVLFQLGKDIYDDDLCSALGHFKVDYVDDGLEVDEEKVSEMCNAYQREYQKYQNNKGLRF